MKNILFSFFLVAILFQCPGMAALAHDTGLSKIRNAFVEASVATYAPDEEVTEKFLEYSDYGRANDVLLLQLYMYVHLPDTEVRRLLDAFDWEHGCWTDIDYAAKDRGRWPATLHVTRMYALAKLYRYPGNEWEGSEELHKLLHSAMGWWFSNMPVCPNWWHNDIGVPKKMTSVLLMLMDELSPEEIAGGLKVLERSKFGMTGQNKVWLAGNNLMKGLLVDDPALVAEARRQIGEEIYVTDNEGIQEDWSFHQHGPQIQFGNYGLAYVDGISFWLRVLKGSEYAFSEEQVDIVSRLMKDGICWSVYRGVMDPSFCGRQNFINGGTGKAYALAVAAQNMAAATDGEESRLYSRISLENLRPDLYANTLVGSRYYWRSDCGIYRQPDWYASIRMHSERTVGFEFTNKENTLANFSADGALIIMQDGREFDNIFAYWDWRKIPGVTAYNDGRPIKCDDSVAGKRNWSSHVGGAADGDVMVATMELDRDGLHALKSVFFFPGCVVNLGVDISVSRDDITGVTTAIDQTHLVGDVKKGKSWVHHASRGYVSLDGAEIHISDSVQTGDWGAVDPALKGKKDSGQVFKCWFEHPVDGLSDGKSGSYAYAVVPCSTARQTAGFAKKYFRGGRRSPVAVLRNDADCQAVRYGDVICAVLHVPGNYELVGQRFDVDCPSVIVRYADGGTSRHIID